MIPDPPPDQSNQPARGDDSLQNDEPAGQIVTFERVCDVLERGEMREDHGRVRWSSNYTTIVSVKDADLETLAVYKPQRGERPLWDFPDGTLCYREVAAYHVSDQLGWDLVAPTVLRIGPKGLGSVQFYVDHDSSINYFALSDDFSSQLMAMAAFDVLINNTDRKGGHCLVDGRGKLWGIDHGICFHSEYKLRTVIWDFAGQPIPDQLQADIQRLLDDLCQKDTLYQHLQPLLSQREIDAIVKRATRLLQRKTYPYPGPGPNYPWPPI